jgi:tetraacyldisaccharide 4'-kinase
MKSMARYWYSKNRWLLLLVPLSYLYQFFYRMHCLVYSLGIKKKFISCRPTIIVGNLTVGGTGKTPFTIALAKLLIAKGHKPGIVTRGYKGKSAVYPQYVEPESDPAIVGDEAILLASKTQCPVVVSPKRAEGIKLLLQNNQCDVILADDGLQHHAIQKDIEIIIIDGERKLGNGFCLPAGPLREPATRLSKVNFVVVNEKATAHKYSMTLKAGEIYNLQERNSKLPATINGVVHAVAAIGNPERFFCMLYEMGFLIKEHSFPDHHSFREQDFSFCKRGDIVIMTEKDAVKCRPFAKSHFWVLPVEAVVNKHFLDDFEFELASKM